MTHSIRALLPATLLLLACASSPPPRPTARLRGEAPEAAEDDRSPLKRAEALFASGDLAGTRAALEAHLEDEDEDAQALYLLARTLAAQGELRGARTRTAAVLALQPENALAWDLYAGLSEALGEHREALEAYAEVRRRSDSVSPLVGIARCSLYLGDPGGALTALEPVRARANHDPWVDYLAYQAYKRLERWGEAERAARVYLGEVAEAPQHAERSVEVRRWLASRHSPLDPDAERAMVDYVRSACRLRLPSEAPAEEAVLAAGPERLFAFDDRPVFVTLFVPASPKRFFGHGRGRNLAAALKGAVEALQDSEGYTPLAARDAAVRIDIGHDLERVELRWVEERLIANPEVVRGVHGLAVRADGREAYCLPGDALTEELADVRAMLGLATTRAGLGDAAWEASTQAVWRFETESLLSPAPGASPIRLRDSEPLPLPAPLPAELAAAGLRGGRWLSGMLGPDGAIARGYGPARDAFDAPGGDGSAQPLPAEPLVAAQAAHALAVWAVRLDAGHGRQTFLAGARHLLGPLLAERPEKIAAQAWLLRALEAVAALEPEAYAEQRRALATTLTQAPWPVEARGVAAAALAESSGLSDAARDRLDELLAGPITSPWEALASAAQADAQGPPQAALEWARSRLAELAPAEPASQRERAPTAPLDGGPRALDADELVAFARLARAAQRWDQPDARALRDAVRARVAELLALQLAGRHRWFLPHPDRALGAFRRALGELHLRPEDTAAALRAIAASADLLS